METLVDRFGVRAASDGSRAALAALLGDRAGELERLDGLEEDEACSAAEPTEAAWISYVHFCRYSMEKPHR